MKTLNIKDPEVYRLAEDLSRRTGASMTAVVREALREKAERTACFSRPSHEETMARIRAIQQQFKDVPVLDHDQLLYDEYGIPK